MRPTGTLDEKLKPILMELALAKMPLRQFVETMEDKYLTAALIANGGNVTQTSLALGVHRNTIHNKIRGRG
jgi:transcriptional regulator of acetoin/glycerol metabolism